MSLKYHQKNKGKIQIQNGGSKQNGGGGSKKKKKNSSTLGKRSKKTSKRSLPQPTNEEDDNVDDHVKHDVGNGGVDDDDRDRDPHGIMSNSKASKASKASKLSRSKSTTRHSDNTGSEDEFYIYDTQNNNNKNGTNTNNEPMSEEMLMVTSILRTLGNFTFVAENIQQLLQHDMLALLYRLVTEIDAGTDSNMLVILMQILSDIGQTSASLSQRSSISSDILNIEVESWLLASILKLGLKNRHCILLQQCMLDQLGTLVHLSPEKNARLLIQHQGEMQIFDRIKELNYPEHMVILSLRLVKSMCIHKDISSHLVKQSNVFNFLTHIMKHWRLKRSHDTSLRIQCCCEVIRSLTNIEKFSKYANKCHVISGLIKILMLNDGDDAAENNNNERIEPMIFIEILKTFVSICSDEENCLKLAKHGTKSILSGIDLYSSSSSHEQHTTHAQRHRRSRRQQHNGNKQQQQQPTTNNGNMQSSNSSLTVSSSAGNTNYTEHNKFVQDIIKHIAALFCSVSKYKSVCSFLFSYNAIEIAYNILAIYSQNVFICDQFICFLTNMLSAKHEVYHVLETKLHTQQLINKILYLHSNSDSLITTCHRYHKCIEVWLRNNGLTPTADVQPKQLLNGNGNLSKEEMDSQSARLKRFPIFGNEVIDNPYRVGDEIEFQERENLELQWVAATVVDAENNWIIIRFLNTSNDEDDSSFRNDRKIHVLKHKERLRLLYAARDARRYQQQQLQQSSPRRTRTRDRDRDRTQRDYASDSEEEYKASAAQQPMTPTYAAKQQRKLKRLHQKQAKQQRQYEMNVFLDEIQRFNWNLIIVSDADGRNSLYKCLYVEIYGDDNKVGYKMIKKEVAQYKTQNADYFRQFGLNTADIHFDYMTLIALSELYNVRIRVFSLDLRSKTLENGAPHSHPPAPAVSVAFECGDYEQTLHLPIIYLAYLHGSHFHLIQDPSSFHIHQRPLIHYLKHSHFSAMNSPNSVSLIRQFRFQKFYEKLFDYFDEDESGKLTGQQLYEFFVSSSLSTEILRTIWDDSVGDNCPTMDLHQFMRAMSLILAKQLQVESENGGGGKYGRIDAIRSHKPGTKHKVRKISTQIPQEKQRRHAHKDENQRNSENDATTYNIIHAGLPNMKYPINPYDTYNHYFYSKTMQMHASPSYRYSSRMMGQGGGGGGGAPERSYYDNHNHTATPNGHHAMQQQQQQNPLRPHTSQQYYDEDEINENLYYQNHSGSQQTAHQHGGNMYLNMRQSTDQTNTTLNHNNNKATRTNGAGSGGGVSKQREFLRFYHSINFGGKQEIYYDKIAEFEYNDIEKMMELDRDILTEEFEMSMEHAALFMSKINKFKRKHLQFKKWLVEQLKLRRYFVKFVNEGILTFDILLTRFQSYHDLVPLIGDKNINDAKLIFKKLPKSVRDN